MEPSPREPNEDDFKRQQMIAAITSGIEAEDYTFVVEVASTQDLLRPYEIVEYMDVKRRGSEDPVEQRRWEEGLDNYLTALDGQEFPEEEIDAINSVVERLQFDRVVSNEDIAEEPEVRSQETDTGDIDWENDFFQPAGIDAEEIERLSATPIGLSIVEDATRAISYGDSEYLDAARQTIAKFQFGPTEKLRELLDVFVCSFAEGRANKALSYGDSSYLKESIDSLREYGSSDSAVLAMEKSIDKQIFLFAKNRLAKAAQYNDNSYVQEAIDALDQFVSTETRLAAMLSELGLA